jgi:hypothetical protein
MKPPPPPPSQELLDAVTRMGAVRTRAPLRAFAVICALFLLYAGLNLVMTPLRPDLPFLSRAWVIGAGVAWLAGCLIPLGMAMLPRRGQVLPDAGRAVLSAAVAAVALMIFGALFPGSVAGHSLSVPLWAGLRHCIKFAVVFAIVPIAVGLLALRRVVLVGSPLIGAAIGGASGALAGFTLHLLCSIAGAAHVSLAHGGAVVVCALVGAAAALLLLARR